MCLFLCQFHIIIFKQIYFYILDTRENTRLKPMYIMLPKMVDKKCYQHWFWTQLYIIIPLTIHVSSFLNRNKTSLHRIRQQIKGILSYIGHVTGYTFAGTTILVSCAVVNTLRYRQNGHNLPDDIFKCIFSNENVWILLKISLKFVLSFELTIFQHWFR